MQYNYNVLKTLKTCCLASGTAHRHRQAELNRHSYNEISFYAVKMKKHYKWRNNTKKLIFFYFLIINCFCFGQENLSKKLFNDFDRITWDFDITEGSDFVKEQIYKLVNLISGE